MGKVNEIAAKLLSTGDVQVVIGYGEGSTGKVRPMFARTDKEAQELVCDERCTQNLALYLYKKESIKLGKPAIVANISALRSVVRLAAEKQLKDGDVIVIYIAADGSVSEFRTLDQMEEYLSTYTPVLNDADKVLLDKLDAMTSKERWEFWQKEMENCIKCYACRQACPLCYCTRCTVEINQPQWISVGATNLGNLEWHVMRAMHLSGRCVECGQCGSACPVGIPIHLLTIKMAQEVKELYGFTAGLNRNEGCAMSTYKPSDKENFIG